jgi:hypothetical protein
MGAARGFAADKAKMSVLDDRIRVMESLGLVEAVGG